MEPGHKADLIGLVVVVCEQGGQCGDDGRKGGRFGLYGQADGLVILSNAGNAPAVEIALHGASTFNSDISYDGMVNLVELGVLNVNYGRKAADADWDPTADVNGDGIVNPAAPARTIAEDITPETVYPVALGPNAVYTPSALDSAGVMVESLHYRSDLDGSAILLAPIVTRPV